MILASNSPRRRQLLAEAGFAFDVIVREIDETFPDEMASDEVPVYLAQRKAGAFRGEAAGKLVLCADTVVVLEERILGKPSGIEEAVDMLEQLSGRSHRVITAVCLADGEGRQTAADTVSVTFRKLDKWEIRYYVEHFKPLDKAGAYGIQEWIGMTAIESIHGSYYTVMGLPVHSVYNLLKPYFNR